MPLVPHPTSGPVDAEGMCQFKSQTPAFRVSWKTHWFRPSPGMSSLSFFRVGILSRPCPLWVKVTAPWDAALFLTKTLEWLASRVVTWLEEENHVGHSQREAGDRLFHAVQSCVLSNQGSKPGKPELGLVPQPLLLLTAELCGHQGC